MNEEQAAPQPAYPVEFQKWLDKESGARAEKNVEALTEAQIAEALKEFEDYEKQKADAEKVEAAFCALEKDIKELAVKHDVAILCGVRFKANEAFAMINEGTTSKIEHLGLIKMLELKARI